MKEIVESYFAHRSMVNHQLASYDDCIPIGDGKGSRMESIVRGIRIGSDEDLEDVPGGKEAGGMIKLDVLDKEIFIRMKGIRLGAPTVREANGAILRRGCVRPPLNLSAMRVMLLYSGLETWA